MDKVLKKKWLKALRSGEYEQARGTLRCGEKYCCLGVLACVIDGSRIAYHYPQTSILTPNEKYQAIPADVQRRLVAGNDRLKLSFLEIADWIEECL